VLVRTAVVLVASRAYLDHASTPSSVDDLGQHRFVMTFDGALRPNRTVPLLAGGRVPVSVQHASNDLIHVRALVRAGLGLALLPRLFVSADLEAGALVEVLTETVGTSTTISVVYAERDFMSPTLRAFVDFMVGWASVSGVVEAS
jgi:DNA-binding transcriptional LysR family regulator